MEPKYKRKPVYFAAGSAMEVMPLGDFGVHDKEHLASWLEDYSLGELWQKNVIAGAPSYGF